MHRAIDYPTCKAKNHQNFLNKEKEFLKEVYEAFWWGGRFSEEHGLAAIFDIIFFVFFARRESRKIAEPKGSISGLLAVGLMRCSCA